jgi:acetyl/propionyl-CoA carboxylase alpha subunit
MNLSAVNYPLITATAPRIYLALLLQTIAAGGGGEGMKVVDTEDRIS